MGNLFLSGPIIPAPWASGALTQILLAPLQRLPGFMVKQSHLHCEAALEHPVGFGGSPLHLRVDPPAQMPRARKASAHSCNVEKAIMSQGTDSEWSSSLLQHALFDLAACWKHLNCKQNLWQFRCNVQFWCCQNARHGQTVNGEVEMIGSYSLTRLIRSSTAEGHVWGRDLSCSLVSGSSNSHGRFDEKLPPLYGPWPIIHKI